MNRELTDKELEQLRVFIFRIVISKLPESADVEELVQEVLIKVWLSWDQLRDKSKLYAWVARITRNEIAGFFKKWNRRENLITELPTEALADPGQLHQMEELETDISLREVLREDEYQVIEPWLHRNMTQREIAEHLGIPVGTVKTRIRRSKHKLKTTLVPMITGPDPQSFLHEMQ